MFGMLDYYPQPWVKNAWTPWVKYLTDRVNDCGVVQAALVKQKKTYTVACTKDFQLSSTDIQSMMRAFNDKSVTHVAVQGRTYTLLPRSFTADPSCLVASSSDNYVIVGASRSMYVVALIRKSVPVGPGDPDFVRNTIQLMRRMVARLAKNKY
jgi:hypothetical protein